MGKSPKHCSNCTYFFELAVKNTSWLATTVNSKHTISRTLLASHLGEPNQKCEINSIHTCTSLQYAYSQYTSYRKYTFKRPDSTTHRDDKMYIHEAKKEAEKSLDEQTKVRHDMITTQLPHSVDLIGWNCDCQSNYKRNSWSWS